MSPYVIIVEFVVRPGAMERFMPLILSNAEASRTSEPGCRRFDVLGAATDPAKVLLYEVYDDEMAFAAHSRSSHFHAFDAAARDLVESKRVDRLTLFNPDKADTANEVGRKPRRRKP